MRRLLFACCSLLLFASVANAEWLEVSSDHFVIYSDQSEDTVRRFAERLELYDSAMSFFFGKQNTKPSPSNRVSIYVVGDQDKVRELATTKNKYLAGFYKAHAGSTVAVIPELRKTSSSSELSPETTLFHEYAHHVMFGLTARAYPRWFVEGFAEFFSGVQFRPDSVGLGMESPNRGYELIYAHYVPIRKMLDFDGGASEPGNDAFYGQSWALFHYLQFAPERAGQLANYQNLLGSGHTALEAAEGAFGDLDELNTQLWGYTKRPRLGYLKIDRKALAVGPINVARLTAGAAAIMPTAIRSRLGVNREQALDMLPEARRVAYLYPKDPTVLAALAEAEFDAGNDDAAIDAADRALAIDPAQIRAQIQKGYALFRKVETGVLPKESWKDVRRQFMLANKIEHDHPIPLIRFYLSYVTAGEPPTRNAIDGLEWAMVLAPFDSNVRWLVAQQMISDNRLAEAARTLAPLAYSPHRDEDTDKALKLLQDLEARIAAGKKPPGS